MHILPPETAFYAIIGVTIGALQSTPRISNETTKVKTSHVERMEFNNQNDNTQNLEV